MQALVVNLYIGVREFLSEHGFEGMCISEDVEKNNAKIALLLLLLNLLLQLGVVGDSWWGWARVGRVMVTLVQRKSNTVQPVNNLELGDVQENTEHVCSAPATDKVNKNITILRK